MKLLEQLGLVLSRPSVIMERLRVMFSNADEVQGDSTLPQSANLCSVGIILLIHLWEFGEQWGLGSPFSCPAKQLGDLFFSSPREWAFPSFSHSVVFSLLELHLLISLLPLFFLSLAFFPPLSFPILSATLFFNPI